MGRFSKNRGLSSLLSNDALNILAATNTDNNSYYIVITRCQAIAGMEEVFYVVRAGELQEVPE
jgi:hypothetical protein